MKYFPVDPIFLAALNVMTQNQAGIEVQSKSVKPSHEKSINPVKILSKPWEA